jgi:hypothetical protein
MFIQTFGAQVDWFWQNDSERQAFLWNCSSTEIQMQLGECLLHPGLYDRCLQELHRKSGNPRFIATACRGRWWSGLFTTGTSRLSRKFCRFFAHASDASFWWLWWGVAKSCNTGSRRQQATEYTPQSLDGIQYPPKLSARLCF